MFKSNYLATQQDRSVRHNAIQSTIFGLPLGGVMVFLMYFANWDKEKTRILISISVVPFVVALTLYAAFMIKLMIKRWNRTVTKINIESGIVSIETFPIFLYKAKKYPVGPADLIIKKTTFPWYGKDTKEGIVIKINNKDEFYLVKDYFDDYETIKNELNVS